VSTLASTTENRRGPYRKPQADVYTFMLIVSLLALILGILCLYFEMKRFDFEIKEAPKVPPAVVAVAPPVQPPLVALARPVPSNRTCT